MKTLFLLASLLLVQNPTVNTTLSGRITMDDSSPLPTVSTFRGRNVAVGLQARVPGTTSQIAQATTRDDGSFVIPLELAGGMGEFSIEVTRIPAGYFVKSIRYGTADLLTSSLVLTSASASSEIQMVLTKTPPSVGSAGNKVSGEVIRPVLNVPAVNTPLVALPGSGKLSVSQSGNGFGPGAREGALSFFRIEQSGAFREEKRLQSTPLEFNLAPGTYEIRGYFRACDGNCGRLGEPSMQCAASFTVTAGQVLYAERLIQNNACTIRLRN